MSLQDELEVDKMKLSGRKAQLELSEATKSREDENIVTYILRGRFEADVDADEISRSKL